MKPEVVSHTGKPVTVDFADTSKTHTQIPFYVYDCAAEVDVPQGCQLVGVEITDDAIDLPSFRHPTQAVYVMGAERQSLSTEMAARCDHMIKIPTKFSLNVATAGAIVMYDRLRLLGGFADRPMRAGQEPIAKAPHVHGGRFSRLERRAKREAKE